jgi:hypothetical protein
MRHSGALKFTVCRFSRFASVRFGWRFLRVFLGEAFSGDLGKDFAGDLGEALPIKPLLFLGRFLVLRAGECDICRINFGGIILYVRKIEDNSGAYFC